jgi:hypothetical protein
MVQQHKTVEGAVQCSFLEFGFADEFIWRRLP